MSSVAQATNGVTACPRQGSVSARDALGSKAPKHEGWQLIWNQTSWAVCTQRCTKITSCCTTCTTTQQRGVNKGLDSNSYEHDQHACAWTKCIMVSSPTSCCAGNGASLFWQCSRPFMVGEGKKRRSRSPCLRKRLRTLAACHTLLEGTSRRRVCSVASSSADQAGEVWRAWSKETWISNKAERPAGPRGMMNFGNCSFY